jgi:Tat protein translocase TatB subunit
VFNFSGSEIVFLLLLALIILGPEKLPDAVRKFGKGYAEFKKVTTGFQDELKSALDEPMREMRETADAFRKAATFELDPHAPAPPTQTAGKPAATAQPTPAPKAVAPPAAGSPADVAAAADDRFPEAGDDTGTASPHGDDLGASAE